MASQITPPLRVGQVLEISFPSFTPRITVHSERELTVGAAAGLMPQLHNGFMKSSLCFYDDSRRFRRFYESDRKGISHGGP